MNLENMKIMKEYAELVLAGKSVSHLESTHINSELWHKAKGDAFTSDNVKYRWGTPEKEMVKHKGGVYPKPLAKEQIQAMNDNSTLYIVRGYVYPHYKKDIVENSGILYPTLEDAEAALKVMLNE